MAVPVSPGFGLCLSSAHELSFPWSSHSRWVPPSASNAVLWVERVRLEATAEAVAVLPGFLPHAVWERT